MGVGTDDDGSSLDDDELEELELLCSWLEELLGTTLLVLLLDGFSVLLDELLEITLLEEDKEDGLMLSSPLLSGTMLSGTDDSDWLSSLLFVVWPPQAIKENKTNEPNNNLNDFFIINSFNKLMDAKNNYDEIVCFKACIYYI